MDYQVTAVARRHTEYDCPVCSANNPCDKALADGNEVRCCYCGIELEVCVAEDGTLAIREK